MALATRLVQPLRHLRSKRRTRLVWSFTNYSAYGQDTLETSRRLTLAYGLRWDFNPPPKGRDGQALYTVQGLHDHERFTLAAAGTPFYKSTYNNFRRHVRNPLNQLSERQGWRKRAAWRFWHLLRSGHRLARKCRSLFPYLRTTSLIQRQLSVGSIFD